MSAGSKRLHVKVDIHQHEDPAGDAERSAIPDARGETVVREAPAPETGRLWREDGKVMYQDAGVSEPLAVRVVWARPLSDRNGPVAVMMAGKKKEVAYYPSLDALSGESRRVALEELAAGMILPRITAIHRVRPRFGSYYWDVETDKGRRKFVLNSPENNHIRPRSDVVIIRDVTGNCFEIAPVSALDPASKYEFDRVL